jgi:hypothetical protein
VERDDDDDDDDDILLNVYLITEQHRPENGNISKQNSVPFSNMFQLL